MAMIKCPECGREISDKAEKCPHCGCPIKDNVIKTKVKEEKIIAGKNSGLGITALVFSAIGLTFIVGLVLSIIDLCIFDGRKKTCSIIALVISGFWLLIFFAGMGRSDNPKKLENTNASVNIEANDDFQQTPENTIDSSKTESKNKDSIFKKGEVAELNDIQVTLTDFVESDGGEWSTPSEGNIFLRAEFEISNNSKEELTVSSIMSFDAYADDYSLDYSFSAIMEIEKSQLDGPIAPGKKMKGWIGWEVPEDYQNVEIHFTDNVWSDNKFIFLIEK